RGMLVAEAVPLREQRDALSELVLADEDRLRGGDVPGVVPAEGRTGRVAVDFVVVAVRHSLDRGRERGLVDAWAVRGVRLARERLHPARLAALFIERLALEGRARQLLVALDHPADGLDDVLLDLLLALRLHLVGGETAGIVPPERRADRAAERDPDPRQGNGKGYAPQHGFVLLV